MLRSVCQFCKICLSLLRAVGLGYKNQNSLRNASLLANRVCGYLPSKGPKPAEKQRSLRIKQPIINSKP